MRVKGLVWLGIGLVWLGIPSGDYAAAVRFFAQTLVLRWPSMRGNILELAAGNGDRIPAI